MSWNPCLKTGVSFYDTESNRVNTGDLFAFNDDLLIKGIPRTGWTKAPDLIDEVDFWMCGNGGEAIQEGGTYLTIISPGISKVSWRFIEHLESWNPEYMHHFSMNWLTVPRIDAQKILNLVK